MSLRSWTELKTLWLHGALLAVVLSVGFVLVDNGWVSLSDEGVYATQAQALVDGGWSSPRPAPELDPDGEAVPLMDSTVVGDRVLAYTRHPAYPLLLVPGYAAFGYSGALATSLLGAVGAALVAAFLARRLDPRYGVPALWIAGVGSPLLFDAYVLWGHSLVTAVAGVAVLGIYRTLDQPRRPIHLAYALPAAALAVMLRSEGVIVMLAVAAVIGLGSLPVRRPVRLDWPAAVLSGGIAAVSVLAYWVDTRISSSIGGSGGYGTEVSNLVLSDRTGPWPAAWTSFFAPGTHGSTAAGSVIVIAAGCLVVAALAVRFGMKWTSLPWLLVLVAAGCWASILYLEIDRRAGLVSGLLLAFPVLTAALFLVGRRELASAEVRRSMGIVVVGVGLLVVTIHRSGGSTEWGGRFFHVLLPLLIGLIVATIDRHRGVFHGLEGRVAVVAVALLLVLPAATPVAWVWMRKRDIAEENRRVERVATRITRGSHRPLAIVWRVHGDGTSRLFWTLNGRVDVLQPAQMRGVTALLDEPSVIDRSAVVVVTDVPGDLFDTLLQVSPGEVAWKVDERESWTDRQVQILVLRPSD